MSSTRIANSFVAGGLTTGGLKSASSVSPNSNSCRPGNPCHARTPEWVVKAMTVFPCSPTGVAVASKPVVTGARVEMSMQRIPSGVRRTMVSRMRTALISFHHPVAELAPPHRRFGRDIDQRLNSHDARDVGYRQPVFGPEIVPDAH